MFIVYAQKCGSKQIHNLAPFSTSLPTLAVKNSNLVRHTLKLRTLPIRYSYLDTNNRIIFLVGFVICLSFLFLEFVYNKMPARLLHQKLNFGEVKTITSEDLKLEEMKQNIMDHVQIMAEKTEKFIFNNSHEKNLIADKFYENLMLMKEEFIAMNNMKE